MERNKRMESAASLSNSQTQSHASKAGGVQRRNRRIRRGIAIALWFIGLILLAVASVLVHNHPAPWPGEVAFSQAVQHVNYWPWIPSLLDFIGVFNNPTPTGIVLGILFTGMILLGWYLQAIFFALAVGIGNALDALIGNYVVRPRPTPNLVHVVVPLNFNSFPSGHCCHMMLFYGFLLFLSFTKPVREWRYHWALIPLQVFAVLNILLMGYSRIYQGEHWLSDTLGGYLSGALWLTLFIFLYQFTTNKLEERRSRRVAENNDGQYK
jgi:membrane-associated phospholipid phosphatase